MKLICFSTLIMFFLTISIIGCGEEDEINSNKITLATDSNLSLYCENEGIFPEKCTLENPDNPFAVANINDDNKFDLANECPSAKSKFYLWSTMLAKSAQGEHQYFTAVALHQLFTEGGGENELVRTQTLKAYRSALDNFYNSNTYWIADWLPDKPAYAVKIRNLVGKLLYDPTEENLLPLFDDPFYALQTISEWGYVYNFESKTLN